MFEIGDIVVEVNESNCPNYELHNEDIWEFEYASTGYYKILNITSIKECPCLLLLKIGEIPDWYCAGTFRKVTKASDEFIALIRKKVDA